MGRRGEKRLVGPRGLEIVGVIHAAFLPNERVLPEDFVPWRKMPRPLRAPPEQERDCRSPWEFYLYEYRHPEGRATRAERWRLFLRKRLGPRWPALRHMLRRRPAFEAQLVGILSAGAHTRGGWRPAFQSPETLAIAIAAAWLRKDRKSVARRVSFDQAFPDVVYLRRGPTALRRNSLY